MAIRINRKYSIILVVAALFLGTLSIWAVMQWKKNTSEPVFIGYYGGQPKLEINLMTGSDGEVDILGIIEASKKFFVGWQGNKEDYWPEPVSVAERPNGWWVKYKRKERSFILNGKQLVESSVPGVITIEVSKSDMSCRGIPGR